MSEQDIARGKSCLLAAWANGKTLQQLFLDGKWKDYISSKAPEIHHPSSWRVKPEPRRKWERAITYSSGTSSSTAKTDNPEVAADWKSKGYTVTEWMEVLP